MRYKFTGTERDAESGLDNFNARCYQSVAGRFASPDPSGLVYVDLMNPKTSNLYTYVENNPTNALDPNGLLTIVIGGTFSHVGKSARAAWGESNVLAAQLRGRYSDPVMMFPWSSWDTEKARETAAESLSNFIYEYEGSHPGEKVTVYAHSHGGNVALLAMALGKGHIDKLVTLGTPFGYATKPSNVYTWFNITGSRDFVQPTFSDGCGTGTTVDCRIQAGAYNGMVDEDSGMDGHSQLWDNGDVRGAWLDWIDEQESKDHFQQQYDSMPDHDSRDDNSVCP